jgi:hypothetical protein
VIVENAGGFREFNSKIQYALLQHSSAITRHAQDQLVYGLEVSDRKRTESIRQNQ